MKKNIGSQKEYGWAKVLVSIPLLLIVVMILILAFYEARKAYWDYRVEEMCEEDGGITVFEKVYLGKNEYQKLGGKKYGLNILSKDNLNNGFPFYYQTNNFVINKINPKVVRGEMLVYRDHDMKVLGKSVKYWRSGGDMPSGIFHNSSYGCPKFNKLIENIFFVKKESE